MAEINKLKLLNLIEEKTEKKLHSDELKLIFDFIERNYLSNQTFVVQLYKEFDAFSKSELYEIRRGNRFSHWNQPLTLDQEKSTSCKSEYIFEIPTIIINAFQSNIHFGKDHDFTDFGVSFEKNYSISNNIMKDQSKPEIQERRLIVVLKEILQKTPERTETKSFKISILLME